MLNVSRDVDNMDTCLGYAIKSTLSLAQLRTYNPACTYLVFGFSSEIWNME